MTATRLTLHPDWTIDQVSPYLFGGWAWGSGDDDDEGGEISNEIADFFSVLQHDLESIL